MLQIERVTKRYGRFVAVDDLSLEVPEGMIFGLLGPNGAGKTTLLRCAMGLMPISSGRIRLFDKHSPGSAEVRPLIGYMPQTIALYPNLTVAENIRFFARLYRVPEGHLQSETDRVLEMVQLTDKRNEEIRALSGGMARRVMLATTLVHRPRLLILDEPTAGVDPLLRVSFWEWFRELVGEGTSIIVTTHHISEAGRCGQVVFLRNGALLDQGTPAELNQRYGAEDLEDAFVRATRSAEETS